MIKKTAIQPMVDNSKITASFLKLSKYIRIGLPRTKRPVTLADKIKSKSMKTGIRKLSVLSNKFLPLNINNATKVT